MSLSPQQQRVLDAIMPIAEIATDGSRKNLTVMPRCHSLIAGQSGSGKSFVARKISDELGLPCLVINVATWVIIASRSEPWTWTTICDWLAGIEAGVLVLDEIEKNSIGGSSEYGTHARMEQHDLLDGVIPSAAKINPLAPSSDPGEFYGFCEPTIPLKSDLARKLRERVMVIGCGAWQSAFRGNARHMGFLTGKSPVAEPPSRIQILASIDPELRQRFRDEVALLPAMTIEDYEHTALSMIEKIPQQYRVEWRNHQADAIHMAVEGTLGMRVFEELLLKAMLLSRNPRQPDSPHRKSGLEITLD